MSKRVLKLLYVYGVVFLLKVIVKSQAEQMLDEQLYKALWLKRYFHSALIYSR